MGSTQYGDLYTSDGEYKGQGAPALGVPTNAALLVIARAQDAQRFDGTSREARVASDMTFDALERMLTDCVVDDKWGNLSPQLSVVGDADRVRDQVSDLGSAAALVNSVLVAGTGACVVGGVSETRFKYDEMRAKMERSRNMPREWKGVFVGKLGGNHTSGMVLNDVPYTST